MGGILGGPPSPPPPPPPPPPLPDPQEEERKRRLEAIERRRRGRLGTIATSPRGVLEDTTATGPTGPKTLLGE